HDGRVAGGGAAAVAGEVKEAGARGQRPEAGSQDAGLLSPGPRPLAPGPEEFLSYLQVERRMSAHTLDAYRRDLTALAQWCDTNGAGEPRALATDQLREFIAAGHRRGLSPRSLQRRLSAIRSFYAWLLKRGAIASSPAAGLRAPKAPRKLPQVLDADEAVQLVELPTDAPLGLRDRAL